MSESKTAVGASGDRSPPCAERRPAIFGFFAVMISVASYTVILDRDKTINEDPGYLNDPAKVALMPRAAEGIRLLNSFGIAIHVATNQSGVSRGLITEAQLLSVNERISALLAAEGAKVGEFFVCPHGDGDACDCRKPKSGLIRQIVAKHGGAAARTFLVGDRARDLECGAALGIRGILVGSEETVVPENCVFRASDLHEAASFILESIFEEHASSHFYESRDKFLPELKRVREAGKKIVFTNGCFDLLHSGHVQLLAQARALGDYLVLGLNSDRSVSALKGPTRPVNSERDRARILAQLPYIDAVVVFDEDTPIELMKAIQPDIQVKGGDYVKEKLPEYEVMRSMGKEIVILPFRKGYSTTGILQRGGHPSTSSG
jgi:rfaE bifunctional protein nucleotidyltransferase chain/domain